MNKKVGRNDPCPCGSKKKYKKCCAAADAARESAELAEAASARQQAVSAAERLALMTTEPVKPVERSLRSQVVVMSKERLVERLAKHGIEVTLEAMPQLAEGRARVWSLAEEVWWPTLPAEVDEQERHVIALAGCELWRRASEGAQGSVWRRWLSAGYERHRASDDAGACDAWRPLGEWLLPQLTPLMPSVEEADVLLQDAEPLESWLQDYSGALYAAALGQVSYAEQGIRFFEPLLEHLAADEGETLLSLRCELAQLFMLQGDRARAEAMLTAVIEAHPQKSAGYANLATALTQRSDDAADRERAIALLEQALALPVDDAEDWDLALRLQDLRGPS